MIISLYNIYFSMDGEYYNHHSYRHYGGDYDSEYEKTDIEYEKQDSQNGFCFLLLIIIIILFTSYIIPVCCGGEDNVLNQNMIEKPRLKKIKFIQINENHENNDICTICLEIFKDKDTISILNCNHTFHNKCIQPWVDNQSTCPICRCILF